MSRLVRPRIRRIRPRIRLIFIRISFAIGPEAGSFLRLPKNPCACPIHRTLLIQRVDEILHVGLVLRITKTVLRSCQSSISRLHSRIPVIVRIKDSFYNAVTERFGKQIVVGL
ncbi:unnamed protein product [Arctogadus glacialis]